MSNSVLPHLLSDSTTSLIADDEEFEDEFGDFTVSEELSFYDENPSTPSSLKNSNYDFSDIYTDFNLSNVEERYQIIGPTENKSTTNIINSIPSTNYFTLWEQLENNISESIDKEEGLHNVDNIENEKEINDLSNYQSNEDLHDPNNHDFENQVPFKSTEECSEEITENLNYVEFDHFLEENVDSEKVKQLNEDIPSEIKPVNQIQTTNNRENLSNYLAPTENNSFPVFQIPETEKSFISDHSIHEKIPSIHSQESLTDDSINVKELDSKISNALEVQASQNMTVKIMENKESGDQFGKFADFISSKINNMSISETKPNYFDNDDEEEEDFHDFLYGATWNSGMPLSVPNLCSKPFEPTKSELPIPMSPQKIVESTTSIMPQFDWSEFRLPDVQDYFRDVANYHTYHAVLEVSSPLDEVYLGVNDFINYSNIPYASAVPCTCESCEPKKMQEETRAEIEATRERVKFLEEFSEFLSAPLEKTSSSRTVLE